MIFEYGGAPPGGDAHVTLSHRRVREAGAREAAATTAFYFAFDETLNVGVDPRGSPVTDDYPAVHNAFDGAVASVRFDLSHEVKRPEVRRRMTTLID